MELELLELLTKLSEEGHTIALLWVLHGYFRTVVEGTLIGLLLVGLYKVFKKLLLEDEPD